MMMKPSIFLPYRGIAVLDLLKNYLTGAVHPDLVNEFDTADKIFHLFSLGESDYEDLYVESLMMIDQRDTGDTTAEVLQITQDLLIRILKEHSITPTDNLPLSALNQIAQSIMTAQNYDVPHDIMNVVYQNETAEELFASVMEVVSGISAEVALTWLQSVDIALIQQIRDIANKQEAYLLGMSEEEAAPTFYADDIRKFIRFMKDPELRALTAIRRGMKVGYPFKVYSDAICQNIEDEDPNTIAKELIAIALISSDGNKDPRAAINANIESYIGNVDTVVRVQSIISTSLLEYNRYEQA